MTFAAVVTAHTGSATSATVTQGAYATAPAYILVEDIGAA